MRLFLLVYLSVFLSLNATPTKLYVSNRDYLGTIVAYDISSSINNAIPSEVSASIASGNLALFNPVINPVTKKLYVVNREKQNISVFDISRSINGQMPIEVTKSDAISSNVFYLAINPQGTKLYVGNGKNILVYNITGSIDNQGPSEIGNDDFNFACNLAINPKTNKLYVTDLNGNVTVCYDITRSITGQTPEISNFSGNGPSGLTVNSDGTKLYVADLFGNSIVAFDITKSIDNENAIEASFDANLGGPQFLVINNNQLYVANTYGPNGQGPNSNPNIAVFDISQSITGQTPIITSSNNLNTIWGLAINPMTNKLYVGNYDTNNVQPIVVFDIAQSLQNATPSEVTSPTDLDSPSLFAILFLPSSLTQFMGCIVKNEFLTQTEYAQVLSWEKSSDPGVVKYQIMLGNKVIACVSATGPSQICLHNQRCCQPSYVLTALDKNGNVLSSLPITWN